VAKIRLAVRALKGSPSRASPILFKGPTASLSAMTDRRFEGVGAYAKETTSS